ncbi:MAG: glutamate synthase [Sulfobacillus benefaciens]|uniref:Glutamate synthase n=1 Tax=Sulfobacillus benefaciens TaxID=453960 RepID=A0A2T2WUS6_9FIRM|nr:MAG: glutamate synthase [Sulfobacillus benefaciens]
MSLALTNDTKLPEVVPPLTRREATDEALRCYYCYDAPCITGCPTRIDIPRFIHQIATGDLSQAARTIMDANILGATCARICPTEALCEAQCVRVQDSRAVSIGRLQRVAMDHAMEHGTPALPQLEEGRGRVAVIGAGPAGMSAAAHLARRGYAVEIFEQKEEGGGLDTYGIVSYREPMRVSLFEVETVRKLGVKFHFGRKIDALQDFRTLQEQYDAIVVAIGMGKVPKWGIPGEDLPGVYDALDLVEQTKTRPLSDITLGPHVIVVGAGNTAVDAATCAKRLGASDVSILYRRGEAAMPAYRYEYEFAKQDGVIYRWWTMPIAIEGASRVEAVRCVKTQVRTGDPSDRQSPLDIIPESEFVLPADTIILAIGQEKNAGIGQMIGAATHRGRVVVNESTYETSIKNVYAVGDCLAPFGEAMVVQAVADGKMAAQAIHERLRKTMAPQKGEKHG